MGGMARSGLFWRAMTKERDMSKNIIHYHDHGLLSRDDMRLALQQLFQRMDRLARQCPDGFPVFSPQAEDRWLVSAGGSWLGGFWAALAWLKANMTQADSDRDQAQCICRRLSSKLDEDTVNRSLIYWYGAGLGEIWFNDDQAGKLAELAADALVSTYREDMACIPLGMAQGGGKEGRRRINIDALAATIQLLGHSQKQTHQEVLRQHTDTLISVLAGHNGAYHAHAHFYDGHFQTQGQAGDWSRGQAWAMLALSRAAERWGEPYLTQALQAFEYWRQSRPALPLNRLSQPEALHDSSAAVIAALAMLSLADLLPDGEQWRHQAYQQISDVLQSRYFIGLDQNNEQAGIFWGCCYKTKNDEEMVEATWGSFLLSAALAALLGRIDPTLC